jgi:hypothetical protein
LEDLDNKFEASMMIDLYSRVMYMDINDNTGHYNLKMIVEFITTPYGEEYLKNIINNRI